MSIANLLVDNNYSINASSVNGHIAPAYNGFVINGYAYPVTATSTLDAASVIGQILTVQGAGGYTITLPSASDVLELLNNPVNGQGFDFCISNNSSGTSTIADSADNTFQAGPAANAALAANGFRVYKCVIHDATGVATPSIFVY